MYNPIYPPTYQFPMITQSNIIWVDNEDEARAKARLLSPGITIIMLDNNRPVAYKGSADMSGKILPVEVFFLGTEKEEKTEEKPKEKPEEREEEHQISLEEYLTKKEFDRFRNSVEQRFANISPKKGGKQ